MSQGRRGARPVVGGALGRAGGDGVVAVPADTGSR
jgi:hypothetical protein